MAWYYGIINQFLVDIVDYELLVSKANFFDIVEIVAFLIAFP